MNQGTQGYRFKKKTEGRKSRETVPISNFGQMFSVSLSEKKTEF
jgi:hypothetical protein